MRVRSVLVPGAAGLLVLLAACGGSTQVTTAGGGAPTSAPGSAAGVTSSDTGSAASSADAGSSGSSPAGDTGWTCPAAADSFTFASGGDVNIQDLWQKTLLPDWSKACPGIKINFVFDSHSANGNLDVAKVGAAIKAGQTVPADLTESYSDPAAQAGLTEQVTSADIPAIANVSKDAMKQVKNAEIPYRGSSVLLAYNSTKVSTPPKTLADLLKWITDHPGKFTYNSPDSGGSGESFVQTVVASKIPDDVLTKMTTSYDPALGSNFAAGLQVLKGLTPSIYQKVYPNGNQAVLDLLGKGEIDMAPVWSDQFLSAQKNGQLGKDFKVAQISDPSFTGGTTNMAIIKTTTHKAAAASFVNWVLQPKQQAKIVTTIAGFPAIPIDKLPAGAQGAFADVDTQNLRVGLESKTDSDLKQRWASTVPG